VELRGFLLGLLACSPPTTFTTIPTTETPTGGAEERCNGIDDDRDGTIDEDGATLCDDGDPCTIDRCAGRDGCEQEPDPETCRIDGQCVAAGTPSPDEVCLVCDPRLSWTEWSPAGSAVPCDDGEICTANDRCDGAGTCRGEGSAPDPDPWEPSSPSEPRDTARTLVDDATDLFLVDGSLHELSDVDSYRYRLLDENQCCAGPCFFSSKQPRPTALVAGAASEVCVQVSCLNGSLSTLDCLEGTPVGDGCCDSFEVIVEHDCSAADDSVDVVVDVVGTGMSCGGYQLRMGNTDSGCDL